MQKGMSALPPKADMCGATRDVRFVPIADIARLYSITSSARASSSRRHVRPSAFAVLRLMTISYFGRLLNRKFGRLLPLEDPIDVARRTPELIAGYRTRTESARRS